MSDEKQPIDLIVKLDVVDVQNYSLRNNRGSYLSTFVLIVAIALFVLFINREQIGRANLAPDFLAGTVCFALLGVLFQRLIIRARIKHSCQSSPLVREEQYYIFQPEGFSVSAAGGSNRLEWSQLYRAVETGDAFYLYPTPAHSYIIPKGRFGTSADLTLFRSYLAAGLDPKKARLKRTA